MYSDSSSVFPVNDGSYSQLLEGVPSIDFKQVRIEGEGFNCCWHIDQKCNN